MNNTPNNTPRPLASLARFSTMSRRGKLAWLVATAAVILVLVVIACTCANGIITSGGSDATAQATATATPAPAHTPTTTLLTVHGGDNSATNSANSTTFHVTGTWLIRYTCQPDSNHDSGFLAVTVHNGNGTQATMSTQNAQCASGKPTTGTFTITESSAGDRYLQIDAAGVNWSLTIIG